MSKYTTEKIKPLCIQDERIKLISSNDSTVEGWYPETMEVFVS